MTTNTKPEAKELMQLARVQAGDVDLLLRQSPLTEDTGLYKEMQAASHAVVACVRESQKKWKEEQFEKNFIVIGKSFNKELRTLTLDCFNEAYVSREKYDTLLAANQGLENKLVSFLRKLQNPPAPKTKKTASKTKK